jgi:hypothetical protein
MIPQTEVYIHNRVVDFFIKYKPYNSHQVLPLRANNKDVVFFAYGDRLLRFNIEGIGYLSVSSVFKIG